MLAHKALIFRQSPFPLIRSVSSPSFHHQQLSQLSSQGTDLASYRYLDLKPPAPTLPYSRTILTDDSPLVCQASDTNDGDAAVPLSSQPMADSTRCLAVPCLAFHAVPYLTLPCLALPSTDFRLLRRSGCSELHYRYWAALVRISCSLTCWH